MSRVQKLTFNKLFQNTSQCGRWQNNYKKIKQFLSPTKKVFLSVLLFQDSFILSNKFVSHFLSGNIGLELEPNVLTLVPVPTYQQ